MPKGIYIRKKFVWNKGLLGFRRGFKHTSEAIEKIRQAKIGNQYNIGKKIHSKEYKEKLRQRFIINNPTKRPEVRLKMRKPHLTARGSGNPAWKGGTIPYCKRQALIRDNYTCRVCGLRDPEIMEVDHIKRIMIPSKLRNGFIDDLNNLQTLCPNCHRRKTNKENKSMGFVK